MPHQCVKIPCEVGDPQGLQLLDISKAFLQVHVASHLQRYQVVVGQGELYVMIRMGFGLCIAPKIIDIIVRWVTL